MRRWRCWRRPQARSLQASSPSRCAGNRAAAVPRLSWPWKGAVASAAADAQASHSRAVLQAGGTADPDIKTLTDQLWRLSFRERSQILKRAFHSTPCGQAGLALTGGNASEESACISPE